MNLTVIEGGRSGQPGASREIARTERSVTPIPPGLSDDVLSAILENVRKNTPVAVRYSTALFDANRALDIAIGKVSAAISSPKRRVSEMRAANEAVRDASAAMLALHHRMIREALDEDRTAVKQ